VLALAAFLLASCQTSHESDVVHRLKATGEVASVRVDRDGTTHVRRTDGRELWFDAEDEKANRLHFRDGGVEKRMTLSTVDAPAELPPGVDAMMITEGGLNYLPAWIAPTPSSGAQPGFAEIEPHHIRGSWRFETGYDTATVRGQIGAQLAASGLTMRPGTAPASDPGLPVIIEAGTRGSDRYVQLRMGARPSSSARSTLGGAGARGQVFYEYRH
jgi:hypothetical protein